MGKISGWSAFHPCQPNEHSLLYGVNWKVLSGYGEEYATLATVEVMEIETL